MPALTQIWSPGWAAAMASCRWANASSQVVPSPAPPATPASTWRIAAAARRREGDGQQTHEKRPHRISIRIPFEFENPAGSAGSTTNACVTNVTAGGAGRHRGWEHEVPASRQRQRELQREQRRGEEEAAESHGELRLGHAEEQDRRLVRDAVAHREHDVATRGRAAGDAQRRHQTVGSRAAIAGLAGPRAFGARQGVRRSEDGERRVEKTSRHPGDEHVDERAGRTVVAEHLVGGPRGDVEVSVGPEVEAVRARQTAARRGDELVDERAGLAVEPQHVVVLERRDVEVSVGPEVESVRVEQPARQRHDELVDDGARLTVEADDAVAYRSRRDVELAVRAESKPLAEHLRDRPGRDERSEVRAGHPVVPFDAAGGEARHVERAVGSERAVGRSVEDAGRSVREHVDERAVATIEAQHLVGVEGPDVDVAVRTQRHAVRAAQATRAGRDERLEEAAVLVVTEDRVVQQAGDEDVDRIVGRRGRRDRHGERGGQQAVVVVLFGR